MISISTDNAHKRGNTYALLDEFLGWMAQALFCCMCNDLLASVIAERISVRQLIRVHMSAMRTYVVSHLRMRMSHLGMSNVTFRNVECHV